MLRYGAYIMLNENKQDGENAEKWQEANIDDILQQYSHQRRIPPGSGTSDNNFDNQQNSSCDVDVDSDNFWSQLFENRD